MNKETDLKNTYYQFHPEMDYQIFVSFATPEVEKHLLKTVTQIGFKKVDADKMKKMVLKENARVLKIEEANHKVSQLIFQSMAMMDKYGPESITPRQGYNVYRYRGVGIMIYGELSKTWELGLNQIGSEETMKAMSVILNRYLAFVLANYNVVGFWGVPVEEGVVIMKQNDSRGEAIFIDMDKQRVYTRDGVKSLKSDFQILRLDETLKNSTRRMSKEELISFLTMNVTYFGYNGLHTYLRKKVMEVAMAIPGLVYPVENFKHRPLPLA